jgi:hypothetical protein
MLAKMYDFKIDIYMQETKIVPCFTILLSIERTAEAGRASEQLDGGAGAEVAAAGEEGTGGDGTVG